jgi:hypothetical protein
VHNKTPTNTIPTPTEGFRGSCFDSCPRYCYGDGIVPGAYGTDGCSMRSSYNSSTGLFRLDWNCSHAWGCTPYSGLRVYLNGRSISPKASNYATFVEFSANQNDGQPFTINPTVSNNFTLEPDVRVITRLLAKQILIYSAPTSTSANSHATPTPTSPPNGGSPAVVHKRRAHLQLQC